MKPSHQLGRCNRIRVQLLALETSYNGSNTLWISNMDVWSSLRWISISTMTSWHHFHSTSYPESQIWGQLGRCNGIRVQLFALETADQWLKHFVYVLYGCMKQSEVDIHLNHDVMTSFLLHKWTWLLKSGANLASVTVWVHPYALETAYQ